MDSPWGRDQWLRREPEEWPSFPGKYGMANDDKLRSGRGSDTPRPRAKASTERPFDMWLQKQLHAMYDEITSEPLPKGLLTLIESDAETKGKRPGSSSSRKK